MSEGPEQVSEASLSPEQIEEFWGAIATRDRILAMVALAMAGLLIEDEGEP